MRPRFDLDVALTSDLRHVPFVLEGLVHLEREGRVRLRLHSKGLRWRDRVVIDGDRVRRVGRPYPWSVNIDFVDHETGAKGRFAVDLQDWREMFSLESLETCQVIFKRMFVSEPAEVARRKFGVEVLPAGMTHFAEPGGWSRGWAFRRARLLGRLESVVNQPRRLVAGVRARLPSRGPAEDRSTLADPRRIAELPEEFAFFQVVFHPWGAGSEAEALNRSRAEIIRALKRRLGERFLGGFVFPGEVVDEYADCASHLPSERAEYLRLVERSTVAISTRGFGASPPWKLCEYLKMGKCIVAERLPALLPEPLVDGEHVSLFEDPEECAFRVDELLGDESLRTRMRRAAASYYQQHVAPEATVWRLLTTASLEVQRRAA